MTLTLPRFRLRTLMVLIAALAIVLALCAAYERQAAIYRARMTYWQNQGDLAKHEAYAALHRHLLAKSTDREREHMSQCERWTEEWEYCRALKRKYREAAARPWRPVAPDPKHVTPPRTLARGDKGPSPVMVGRLHLARARRSLPKGDRAGQGIGLSKDR